jgi:aminomethyltransferase
VREAAGLIDMSGLKKVHVTGPDSLSVCNHLCTRDLAAVAPGQSTYALILNDDGRITDDCVVFHRAPNDWLLVHGGGGGFEQLQRSAEGKNVGISFDDDLHILSLQGPKSHRVLAERTAVDLADLKYFRQVPTTLFGRHVMISRTGYSGERGYEIFARADDAGPLWDAILDAGGPLGVLPCSFTCIDLIRVEAGLLFYPYDMNEENTPWEAGLGFTVSTGKQSDFRGKAAVMAARGKEKMQVVGIVADCGEAVEGDAEIKSDNRTVGRITVAVYSTLMDRSLALAQVESAYAKPGVKLEVHGPTIHCTATTHSLPFYDPEKRKRTAD